MERLFSKALRWHRCVKKWIQIVTDGCILIFSLMIALKLGNDGTHSLYTLETWVGIFLCVPATLFLFNILGFYSKVVRFGFLDENTLYGMTAALVASALMIYISEYLLATPPSLSSMVIFTLLTGVLLVGARSVWRGLHRYHQRQNQARVLIYGAGAAGSQLVKSLFQGCQYSPVAYVDDWRGMHGTQVEGLRVYSPAALTWLVEQHEVERILLAIPSAPRSRRREILEQLSHLSVPIQTVPGIEDVISGKARIQDICDVAVEDLLGRDPVPARQELLDANIRGKIVMVTGAGGSIGSELCRQIARLKPLKLLLVDNCEYALYAIDDELRNLSCSQGESPIIIVPLLGSVREEPYMHATMQAYGVNTVYHAAAYKHVPMVESNVAEGIRNNVYGTLATAQAAVSCGVEAFVLVSTDKAVRPTNVMGTTKRLAELICQALTTTQSTTRFSMVRFGNVLGSSGSVIPLFRRQIAQGGPITVTDERIIRYFMTIQEAASLVLQAGAMARGGEVFVLDMGEPVMIAELARSMVHLSGLDVKDADNPDGDIEIVFTGLRPGEKLYEELLISDKTCPTLHPRICSAMENHWSWPQLEEYLQHLFHLMLQGDMEEVRYWLLKSPANYSPKDTLQDSIWKQIKGHIKPAISIIEENATAKNFKSATTAPYNQQG